MNAIKAIYGLVSLLVTIPIWYYLLYSILTAINASQLQWFLFLVYVPIAFLMAILQKIIELSGE